MRGSAILLLVSLLGACTMTSLEQTMNEAQHFTAAFCTAETPWFDADKVVHFFGTAFIGGVVAAYHRHFAAGVSAGLAVGAVREAWKIYHGGQCEASSIAWDIAGSIVGSAIGMR